MWWPISDDVYCYSVINACNASLRNSKFSTMAVRTRRQYLNDLAENSTLAITIDQANTSGRVGKGLHADRLHNGSPLSLSSFCPLSFSPFPPSLLTTLKYYKDKKLRSMGGNEPKKINMHKISVARQLTELLTQTHSA